MTSHLRFPRHRTRYHYPSIDPGPLSFLSVAENSVPGSEVVSLNRDATYLGEPAIQSDGTEGNGAYYQGNYLPTSRVLPYEHQKYWRNSPYWSYFHSIWGGAPMADQNFELWLRGFFKDFSLPRHPQDGQTTHGLPAWLHYYSNKYDPLVDPPYASDYSLFATDAGAEAEEVRRPAGAENLEIAMGGESSVFGDCTEYRYGLATIDRPCAVRAAQRHQVRPYRKGLPHYFGGLDAKSWSDKRNMAGPMAGSEMTDLSLKDNYVKTDSWWSKGNIEGMPANMPPVPPDPELPPSGMASPPASSESDASA